MINFELYRVFYAVARCGSLTRAAEELHISQPAASQALKQLESRLGTPLFKRKHHGMELTASGGELIFSDVETAVRLLEGAEQRIAERKSSAKGTLRIGASDTIFQYALAEKIVEFNRLYPQVTIELISGLSPAVVEALKADRCDVGFINLPIAPDNGAVVVRTVMYLNDIFIAGKRFAALREKPLALRDLQNYPLLLMEERTAARKAFQLYTESHGVRLNAAVETGSWDFMKRLVAEGMGIGCIPREYTENEREEGKIFELNISPPLPVRSVGMALPKNAAPSYALKLFTDLLGK